MNLLKSMYCNIYKKWFDSELFVILRQSNTTNHVRLQSPRYLWLESDVLTDIIDSETYKYTDLSLWFERLELPVHLYKL